MAQSHFQGADPVFPTGHGLAFCEAVPGARLVKLEGGGHELHSGHRDEIIEAIAEHTEAGSTVAR